MVQSACLCGAVRWQVDGAHDFMTHCHCSRCRKTHGVPFATYTPAPLDAFRLDGREHVTRWESSPGFFRPFCARCGSVVPGEAWNDLVFIPAGNCESDPGVRPQAHIFVASRAAWYEIRDALPCFDAYPPGIDAPVVADRGPVDPPTGAIRGSCLCGGVGFVIEGTPFHARYCHCSRCRKGRSAAFAWNAFVSADALRLTRGAELIASFKLPDAERFAQSFCRTCGSCLPHVYAERRVAVVPMGALDDDPGIRPVEHIFLGSKAPWYDLPDDGLARHDRYPPAA